MKFALAVAIGAGAGFGAALLWLDREPQPSVTAEAPAPATPQAQPARSASDRPRATALEAAAPRAAVSETVAQAAPRRGAEEVLNELATIQVTPGLRPVEQVPNPCAAGALVQEGPSALPALRRFLASGGDVAYRTPRSDTRSASPTAPSRLAAVGIVRRGPANRGSQAEQILGESASATSRGNRARLSRRAPRRAGAGKYRDAAHGRPAGLLANGVLADRYDPGCGLRRPQRFGDTTDVSLARPSWCSPMVE